MSRWMRFFRLGKRDLALDKEVAFHIEERVSDLLKSGLSEAESRRIVRQEFGGAEQVKEYCRDVQPMQWIETFLRDLTTATRLFRKRPSFALAAVGTLTLAIGMNTAIFSLISFELLQPLPYPDADNIIQVWFHTPSGASLTLSIPQVQAIAAETDIFQDVAAYDFGGPGVNLTDNGNPEQVAAIHVAATYFHILGAPIELGRTFTAKEDRPHGERVVVLSDQLWRRRFAGDREIIGRSISLGGEPYTVVGVLSPSFRANPAAQLWLPLQIDWNTSTQAAYVFAIGRLRRGVSMKQANARLKQTFANFRLRFPLFNPRADFQVKPLRETTTGDIQTALIVLLVAVAFVLLIACSNVANLLLARAGVRQREMALRSALGGSRARLIGQALTECGLLAASGGFLGLAVGRLCLMSLLTLNPDAIPFRDELVSARLDWRVLLFACVLTVGATLLCGLLPALRVTNDNLMTSIRGNGPRTGANDGTFKLTSVLLALEVALAVMLLTGAGLMIRTFAALRQIDSGIRTHNILTMQMSLQGTSFQNTAAVTRLVDGAIKRLRTVSGVRESATTWTLPVEAAFGSSFIIEGRPLENAKVYPALMRPVSSDYDKVFGIPLKRGRFFNSHDTSTSESVCVISEAMAKEYWPHANPIGDRITLDKHLGPEFFAPPREIVGVAGDVRDEGLNQNPMPMVYIPQSQAPDGMTKIDVQILPITWLIRTADQPYALVDRIRQELVIASRGLAVGHIRSMDDVVKQSTSRSDFNTVLMVGFGVTALMMAAVGVYGLISFWVEQRTRELGIRAALGARPDQLQRLVVLKALGLTSIGMLIGLVGSSALAKYMRALLFGVNPLDLSTVFISCALLGLIAILAGFLPARRASRLDPLEVLRSL